MTSLIFASVNHVAHVEPCDDAEDDESRRLRIHEVIRPSVRGWSRERATEPHGHMLS